MNYSFCQCIQVEIVSMILTVRLISRMCVHNIYYMYMMFFTHSLDKCECSAHLFICFVSVINSYPVHCVFIQLTHTNSHCLESYSIHTFCPLLSCMIGIEYMHVALSMRWHKLFMQKFHKYETDFHFHFISLFSNKLQNQIFGTEFEIESYIFCKHSITMSGVRCHAALIHMNALLLALLYHSFCSSSSF